MTTATPSSSLVAVRPEAAATASGWALPIAKEAPAQLSISMSLGMSPKATTSAGEMPRSAQQAASVVALETPCPLTSRSAEGLERVKAAVAGRRTGQAEEGVGGQLGVVGQQLDHGRTGARGLLVQQLLGDRHRGSRVQMEGRVGRFVVDAGGHLDGEGGAGGRLTQAAYDMQGVHALQRPYGEQLAVRPQVGDHGAVGADRRTVALDVVPYDVHPAGWPAGDEEDLDPGLLGRREGRDRARGQRLVVAQQGAVEVGGDQPGHGGKRRLGH